MPSALTHDQLEARKEKAVRFTRDVIGDDDRADEIEDESVEDYAARRRIEIVDNPRGRIRVMPKRAKTKAELEAEVEELREENEDLRDENEDLQEQVEAIADIVAPADEGEGDDARDDDAGDDDNGEGDDQGED